MNNERAFQYYTRLLPLGVKQDVLISLPAVAEHLCTTPRHGRTLLQALQQRGWISWTPKVGRNQRSVLHLNYTLTELQHAQARFMIENAHYESALAILEGDQQRFMLLLQDTSGATMREGQLHIQLIYQRIFQPLLPHKPLRNSERFLIRQVYACLTTCDHRGQIDAQLAHHWQCNNDATLWRFYIRPQLTFHSGTPIDANLIRDLFMGLRTLPEYENELAHVKQITASHQCIQFELATPDKAFAALLSDLRYSIQPPGQLSQTHDLAVDGSGPFQVMEQSDQRLRLRAFDHYFSLRSLTDTVTIWQFEETPSQRIQLGRTSTGDTRDQAHQLLEHHAIADDSTQSRIENGCLYLLFNMGSEHSSLTLIQRKYLSSLLSPALILQDDQLSELLQASIPAYNLLPDWTQIRPQPVDSTQLPSRLDIAVYDHLVILDCARVLSKTLNQMGIESEVHIYSFDELNQGAEQHAINEPLIIASFNTDDNLPVSVFRWFCSNAILHQGLSAQAKKWLKQEIVIIREQSEISDYLPRLESLGTTMRYESWLSPLFHHRQTLKWRGVL